MFNPDYDFEDAQIDYDYLSGQERDDREDYADLLESGELDEDEWVAQG